jgi:hypothetical protein
MKENLSSLCLIQITEKKKVFKSFSPLQVPFFAPTKPLQNTCSGYLWQFCGLYKAKMRTFDRMRIKREVSEWNALLSLMFLTKIANFLEIEKRWNTK